MSKTRTQAELRDVLTQWEKGASLLAPLEEIQNDSVLALVPHADYRDLPSLPPTQEGSLVPDRGLIERNDDVANDALEFIETPVDNAAQFLSWFGGIEASVEKAHEASFVAYVGQLSQYSAQCDDIMNCVDASVNHLNQLHSHHQSVAMTTTALHDACQHLMHTQNELGQYSQTIMSRLKYFTELDSLAHKLSASSFSVSSEQLHPLLDRLDECIHYLSQHKQYKDSDVYLLRFRQTHNKALSLIKVYVCNSLRTATQQVQQQLEHQAPDADPFLSLIVKFRPCAPKIKALMDDVYKRGANNSDYMSLLQDCIDFYCTQRSAILTPAVTQTISDILRESQSNLPAFIRNGCSYITRVCGSEYQLYLQFFRDHSPAINEMLVKVSGYFYDEARPLFIYKGIALNVLVELCAILQVEVVDDGGAFAVVAQQMLGDVQEKLLYRAQSISESSIRGYVPTAEDLNYPDRLMEGGKTDKPGSWFSPVATALTLLSSLYRSISKSVFEEISHEIVSGCVQSLLKAGANIAQSKGELHGMLFLIRNFLVLREEITPFGGSFTVVERQLDFSRTKEAAADFMKRTDKIFTFDSHNSLLGFLIQGAPLLTDVFLDSRQELDQNLKIVCQRFIQHVALLCNTGLLSFLAKVEAFVAADAHAVLRTETFATPERVREVLTTCQSDVRTQMKNFSKLLALYLNNPETIEILVKPIRMNVLDAFSTFEGVVRKHYHSDEDLSIIGLPSKEQLLVLFL